MRVILPNQAIDTDKEPVIFMFNDDNEFNEFMAKMAATPVKTSGLRMFSMIPGKMVKSPLQAKILDAINGLDGAFGKDQHLSDQIIDNTIDRIGKIIKGDASL